MNTKYFFIALFSFTMLSMTSCLEEGDNYSECYRYYCAKADSVQVEDINDTIFISSIKTACTTLKLTNTLFQEYNRTEGYNAMLIAIATCDSLARADYETSLNKVSRNDILNAIKKASTMTSYPLDSLGNFSIVYHLYEYHYSQLLNRYERDYSLVTHQD